MLDYSLESNCGEWSLSGEVMESEDNRKYWHEATHRETGGKIVIEHSAYEAIDQKSFDWYIATGFQERGYYNKDIREKLSE